MNADSVYEDGDGNSWHIGRLLASADPRGVILVDVLAWLLPYLHITPWEEDGGTPSRIGQYVRGWEEGGVDSTPIPPTQREHVMYVRSIVEQLRNGGEPAPIVIGRDGRLWDGLHRLVAYSVVGRKRCYAVCFAENVDDLIGSFDDLRGVLTAQWLNDGLLIPRQGEFWGASGFPRLVCDQFLVPCLAKRCYLEMLHFGGWEAVVTEFYSQREVVVERNDGRIGDALRVLVAAFCSLSMRKWIARCTGVVVDVVDRPPTVVLHRMCRGDYIGVHNDYRPQGEAFRLTLFLAGNEVDEEDGVLVAMDRRGRDALEIVPPRHNRLFAFGITGQSNHLVTEVSGSDRYSIVFSYFPEELE